MKVPAKLLATAAVSTLISSAAMAQSVEVLHWWTAGGEAAALNVLKEDLAGQGIGWEDMPVAGGGGEAAATTLKARVAAGNPPTAAQLLGMQVREWADEGALGDLTAVATEGHWADVVPSALQDFAVRDGKWNAVPVNIHRPNWLWINAAIFEENGLTPPTTWEEFNTVAQTLKDKGITPLAHGGQPWQDATIFDDVVLGIGGADFYRKAIIEADMDALGSDTMVQVFNQMRTVRGFVDDNFSGRDWNLATAMVLNGEAAMQLMGDWAKGEIVRADMTPGTDILCVTAPGTEGSYLFNTDFFAAFDVSDDNQAAQSALAASVMSPAFQEAFNLVKGSIPARTDVAPDNFDACGQKAMADIKEAEANGTLLGSLAHGHGQTSAVQRAIFDVVTEHFNSDMSAEDAVEELQIAVESAQL
ncbi:ABC transporter substrate-binding protein [Donghicola tyrosinivorans]|uniref:Probable sugar-binding periplasmic protein n=1 Tax=Donghicola tyrosinivorans TaxID=1652492 RepID=A0A2T0WKM3_9RHOB|nr:ABC transporter substrate-binding protein [Donghicola tyrosinivorans]PRY87260.1 glucose/mannose transport system substrate-binding protein [Donghicola tyrosinivorans]